MTDAGSEFQTDGAVHRKERCLAIVQVVDPQQKVGGDQLIPFPLSYLFFPIPALPLEVGPLNPARGPEKRRKFPPWGLGGASY